MPAHDDRDRSGADPPGGLSAVHEESKDSLEPAEQPPIKLYPLHVTLLEVEETGALAQGRRRYVTLHLTAKGVQGVPPQVITSSTMDADELGQKLWQWCEPMGVLQVSEDLAQLRVSAAPMSRTNTPDMSSRPARVQGRVEYWSVGDEKDKDVKLSSARACRPALVRACTRAAASPFACSVPPVARAARSVQDGGV